ncbi:MAG: hypothetical protein Q8M95_06915 [Candidatus Methanoperedens sp.]|nr:hypothetical protein [Candidatus Methanoperedens sp.]
MKQQLHVATSADERRVVDSILQSLAKYMLDSNIDVKYLSEMKLQKIVFKTVEELELPVTRSGYIRGCMVHPGGTLTGSVKKKTIERLVRNPEGLSVDPDIYSCFNSIRVNRIFYTKRNDFLRDLYRHMEPERFRNEYVPNNELILSLEEMSRGIYDGVNTVISENISRLYLGLQGDELFKKVSDKFYDFLDFMENVCIEVEGSFEDGAEITPADLEFFKNLSDVYYSNVWIEPASIISIETAQGPNAKRVIEQRQGYLPLAAQKIEEPLNELKHKAHALNLSLSEVNVEKAYNRSRERIGTDAGKNLAEMLKIYAK